MRTIGLLTAALCLAIPVVAKDVVYYFDLEQDPGWLVEGEWGFGVPAGQGGSYLGPDPTSGHTGTNVYGYNLDGDYPDDMPKTLWLTTAALDFTGYTEAELHFWRWLGVEAFCYDQAWIEASNDGVNWVAIWHNPDG